MSEEIYKSTSQIERAQIREVVLQELATSRRRVTLGFACVFLVFHWLAAVKMFLWTPRFEDIFKDILGDDAALPLITQCMLPYGKFFAIPVAVLLTVWVVIYSRRQFSAVHSGVLLSVLGFGTLLIYFVHQQAMFLPLLKLVTNLGG